MNPFHRTRARRHAGAASAWLIATSCLWLAACSDGNDGGPDASDGHPDAGTDASSGTDAGVVDAAIDAPSFPARPTTIGGDRPAKVVGPDVGDDAELALVVLLHGFGSSGLAQDLYFRLGRAAEDRGDFVVVLPDGTRSDDGRLFWNATDACCNYDGVEVDDVSYLRSLITEAMEAWPIDPGRVYLFGHSNGGYMAHRMACEASDLVTGIMSLAGQQWNDPSRCTPSQPVSILQVHGTADTSTRYDGGTSSTGSYPGAVDTVDIWADILHCDDVAMTGAPLDLVTNLEGAETRTRAYSGCDDGVEVALWTIDDGSHLPLFTAEAKDLMLDWLFAHARP